MTEDVGTAGRDSGAEAARMGSVVGAEESREGRAGRDPNVPNGGVGVDAETGAGRAGSGASDDTRGALKGLEDTAGAAELVSGKPREELRRGTGSSPMVGVLIRLGNAASGVEATANRERDDVVVVGARLGTDKADCSEGWGDRPKAGSVMSRRVGGFGLLVRANSASEGGLLVGAKLSIAGS